MRRLLSILMLVAAVKVSGRAETMLPYQDPSLTVEQRVADLLGRLSIEEKILMVEVDSPPIDRLEIPAINWWSEGARGIARAGRATIFPHAIAIAATWDTNLAYRIAWAVSDEMRVKAREMPVGRYRGLCFWTPTVDMVRDPRWGRIQETFGEDPLLVSRMSVEFIRGLQGDDPRHLKTAATAKHLAVYGQETDRHSTALNATERVMREYYFPSYEASIKEAHVSALMTAFSGVNGLPSAAHPWILRDVMRRQFGFQGVVFTDWGATRYIGAKYKAAPSDAASVLAAMDAGVDVMCEPKSIGPAVSEAVKLGLVTEAMLDEAVMRTLTLRFRLGMFDPPELVRWSTIPSSVVGSPEHVALSRDAGTASIVLLKNAPSPHRSNPRPILPLDQRKLSSIAVLGPHAGKVYMGSYIGDPAGTPVSVYDGIVAHVDDAVLVRHVPWYDSNEDRRRTKQEERVTEKKRSVEDSVRTAAASDVVILALGLNARLENEGKDRLDLELPKEQIEFVQRIMAVNPNTVAVLFNGGPLAVPWLNQHVPAIIEAWLQGEQAGHSVAKILFGEDNPAGRLPLTCCASLAQLPPLTDCEIYNGRTYMYLPDPPLYPFGHGLSYTTFQYSNLRLSHELATTNDTLTVTFDITNTGSRDGDEIAQLYIRDVEASVPVPIKQLRGFHRLPIPRGETRTVSLSVKVSTIGFWDEAANQWKVEPGKFEVMVGASSEDLRLCGEFTVN
jgi:beta-glucosidase